MKESGENFEPEIFLLVGINIGRNYIFFLSSLSPGEIPIHATDTY